MSRHRHRVLLFILCCPLLLTPAARAAKINAGVKASTPIAPNDAATISSVIDEQVALLASGDPSKIPGARATLIDEADTAASAASPAYQDAYASLLAKAIAPLLKDKSRYVRLNAAIVIGQVAARVSHSNSADQFAELATTLLQSKEWSTEVWGMKTAKCVLASTALKNNKLNGLNKTIVAAVRTSAKPEELIEEAYYALTFEPATKAGAPTAVITNLGGMTLADVLELVDWRTQQLKAGGKFPNPKAESIASGFYSLAGFAAVNANPQMRDKTLKVFGELTCNQIVALVNRGGAGNPENAELVDATRSCGSAMGAFGQQLFKPTIGPPMASAEGLFTVGTAINHNLTVSATEAKLKEWCEGLKKALKDMNIDINVP